MTLKTIKTYRLSTSKVDQRLLLRALAEENMCEFSYKPATGVTTIKGTQYLVEETNHRFCRILMKLYLSMAHVQATHTDVPMATIRPLFMREFVDQVIARLQHGEHSKRAYSGDNPIKIAAINAANEVELA